MNSEELNQQQETQHETQHEVQQEPIDFKTLLSEEIRDRSNLKDFKSADELAKSYLELQSLVGNSVRIPSEDASDEAKRMFLDKVSKVDGLLRKDDPELYNKLGRPEAPTAYNFGETLNEELLTNLPSLNEEVDGYKQIAHELGLSQEQAKGVLDYRLKLINSEIEKTVIQQENTVSELKKAWGDQFENKLNSAKAVLNKYNSEYGDTVQQLLDSGAGNNVAFIRMMTDLAETYSESRTPHSITTNFGETPESAKAKIVELKADPEFKRALNKPLDPKHKEAVEKLRRLYSIAYN